MVRDPKDVCAHTLTQKPGEKQQDAARTFRFGPTLSIKEGF